MLTDWKVYLDGHLRAQFAMAVDCAHYVVWLRGAVRDTLHTQVYQNRNRRLLVHDSKTDAAFRSVDSGAMAAAWSTRCKQINEQLDAKRAAAVERARSRSHTNAAGFTQLPSGAVLPPDVS